MTTKQDPTKTERLNCILIILRQILVQYSTNKWLAPVTGSSAFIVPVFVTS